ncbi:MAG TPA: Hsp20/alpha crystallin family protein [Candidatus Acidoferrum sp.]|nr:Hsp20/alpha crystallin family protein [Candidatus Acidoferrum sp.]
MNAVVEKRQTTNGTAARPFVAPEVNIYERDEGYVIEAEMPGVAKNGLEITLEGNTLTFVGRRIDEEMPGNVLYRESRAADYRRAFELDPVVDTQKISAEMHQGVLTLRLPKMERVKPRKIEIK